ncbi:hypothetical protein [Candidatus Contendibacter odensensis]|uniref:PEP-CTERM protein-sorting domain-containing protein n=1 Tax=Candidatus Contendobacter odensis Run_B_J11 TaxID=1400861 RepID=A0A7U7G9Z8_9GAMM|nr:hypothetical protein [Candidatus Contendobacter odensis]CDH44494.1 exported hypothetical protein [Candidatus Contendobacter odensis Run_B_J11]
MKKLLTLSLALISGLGLNSAANAITVDGGLSDWGLTNQWTPSGNVNGQGAGTYQYNGLNIYYTVEDYISGNGGRVDPGYGGQAYDAEALYVTWDSTNLYIALVTGHDPNTKQAGGDYAAGDFALNFWNGTSPDSNYEVGIRTPHQFSGGNPANIGLFTTGVYQTTNGDWLKDPFWHTQAVTSLKGGLTPMSEKATMSIQQGPEKMGAGSGQHWIYEVSVAKSVFGALLKNNDELNVSWTMNCANDVITVEDDVPVDEPPVWALLGLTLPAMFWRRRRSVR